MFGSFGRRNQTVQGGYRWRGRIQIHVIDIYSSAMVLTETIEGVQGSAGFCKDRVRIGWVMYRLAGLPEAAQPEAKVIAARITAS